MDFPHLNNIHEPAPGEFETVVLVSNELGLHARPAALVAQTAQRFAADVFLKGSGHEVDAKSILDILSLAAAKGTTLTIRSRGGDAEACIRAIANLIRTQFEEASP